jgi:hypothetical protein
VSKVAEIQIDFLNNWKNELIKENKDLQEQIDKVEIEKKELKIKKRFIDGASKKYEKSSLKQVFLKSMNFEDISSQIENKGNELHEITIKNEQKIGFNKTMIEQIESAIDQ